ncbi:MAG: SNF2 helicase associated domain-containing protein [Alkalibacterium sp.]|nr:SNF2 helicase associated domain-containing protein [Alkalibacterium sp.]
MSQLKQIVDVSMDEEVTSLLYQAPFEAHLYMDTRNDNLLVRPVFNYGSVTIYPLEETAAQDEEKESIVVRQWAEESKVLSQLYEEIPLPARKGDMWELTQTDTISDFLYDALPALADHMEIFLSQSARSLLYSPSRQPKITMEMRESSNLLDISFDTEDISTDELRDLLKELEKNQSYYRLSSGQIVNLKDPAFQAMRRAKNSLDLEDDEIDKDMTVSVFQGLSAMEEDTIQTGKRFKDLVKQLFSPEELAFELPEKLEADMRPYQVTGYKWLKSLDHYGFGGVLADDMGLGKTVQTIAFIQSKIESENGKYLIICPSSVLFNWQHEWDKFVPDTETIIISGTKGRTRSQAPGSDRERHPGMDHELPADSARFGSL